MGGVEGIAFINSKCGNLSKDQPDIGLQIVSGSTVSGNCGIKTWKVHGLREMFYKSILNKDVWSAIPVSKMSYSNIQLNFL